MEWIRSYRNGCLLEIHVQPQARLNEVVGMYNGRLKVKIKSPPVEGKANEALVEFLAKELSVSRSSVELVKGEHSRQKQIYVHGVEVHYVVLILLKCTTS